MHCSELPWGVWGPHAVTAYLKKTGEDKYAFPREVLYPIPFEKRRRMGKAGRVQSTEAFLTDKTTSIHLYGRRIRTFLGSQPEGLPEERCLIDTLLKPAAPPTGGVDFAFDLCFTELSQFFDANRDQYIAEFVRRGRTPVQAEADWKNIAKLMSGMNFLSGRSSAGDGLFQFTARGVLK